MRIGFLFNHDQIHQVAHSLPIALALARGGIDAEIVVAVTSATLLDEVMRLGGADLERSGIVVRKLALRGCLRRLAARATAAFAPAGKLLVYGDHLDFFRSLDILVAPEKTSLRLRAHHGLRDLKLVHTRHGAGDRAVGFDKASAGFDLVLASGEKIRKRLIAEAGVAPEKIRVCGYPKFDVACGGPPPFVHDAGDDRPIVLYNPHVSPHLSSWYRMGAAVLDWFARQDRYRLIFAPHVMLFHRRFVLSIDRLRIARAGTIARSVLAAPHIHVDLGSAASTDMTYTRAADIYLGDVSSQIYEFLETPRPCLFLDAQGDRRANDPNFAHWAAGPVIGSVDQLGDALQTARIRHHASHRDRQRQMFAASFDLTEQASSVRAANAIAQFFAIGMPGIAPAPNPLRPPIAAVSRR